MTDLRNTLPATFDGIRSWGGNPPMSKLSADGLVFYGLNVKDAGGTLWYVVYSIGVDGAQTVRLKLGPSAGQGTLDIDNGWLIVTLFRSVGDVQPSDRVPVPGWVRWPTLDGKVAALERQVAELETELGNVAAGTMLPERYEKALEKLCAMLEI